MELLRLIDDVRAAGEGECALATVVETSGSTYRRAGARLIVRSDRRVFGAVSGGCLESDLVERALDVLRRGHASLVRYRPADDDPIFGFGSGCPGEVAVLIEPFPQARRAAIQARLMAAVSDDALITTYLASEPALLRTAIGRVAGTRPGAFVQRIVARPSLFLFGASPAAEPLLRFAKQLGWSVTIADHRPIFASDERFASADAIEIGPAEELPSRFSYPTPSAAVVMTHHYARDLELVGQLARHRLAYLGVVGSRDRARRLVEESIARGADGEMLHSLLRAPAGLDLGVDAPSEIALSIVAEIQAVLRGASGAALRDRRGRIHGAARSADRGGGEAARPLIGRVDREVVTVPLARPEEVDTPAGLARCPFTGER